MACVGRLVMLSVGKEDEASEKEKVISVIIAKGQMIKKKRRKEKRALNQQRGKNSEKD